MDLRLELVVVPVSDVERAKAFYESLGFDVDVDFKAGDEFRVVQLTPPGSACSITIGKGVTEAEPGSTKNLHLVVTDIDAAHAYFVERGIDITEVRHFDEGKWVPGPDPAGQPFGSFAFFSDPDGNTWALQQGMPDGARA